MESYTGKGRGRVEGMDKATGRAVYAADYYEENMLHLAIVLNIVLHNVFRCKNPGRLRHLRCIDIQNPGMGIR